MHRLTLILPLYQAVDKISDLVGAVSTQTHPEVADQKDWLQVIFIDNASTDGTLVKLQSELAALGNPSHYQVVANPTNLGLSGSLNKAFSMVQTPFAGTCHSDCLFATTDYLSRLLSFLEKNPEAGAITGQPTYENGSDLPLAEKVNLVTNLMDIFSDESDRELVPVGFAEGRCDGFRMEALQKAGFYDTTLKLAGEDQVLAAKLRKHGYQVYKAPHLYYFLSLSAQQDSLSKLPLHQRRFGRAHPYILLSNPGTHQGVLGKKAGWNRNLRTLLRLSQVIFTFLYLGALAQILFFASIGGALQLLSWVVLGKILLFYKHLRTIPFELKELALLFAIQPLMDISYTWGVAEGLAALLKDPKAREIS